MKLAVQLNTFLNDEGTAGIADQIADRAVWAEQTGFKTFFMMDHFFQLGQLGPFEDPMLDVFGVLSYVAAKTKTINLGQMVLGVTYRHPAITIKQQTTLDVLSGGRTYFGIGAAWFEREHHALGVPFPPLKERFERLEEQLQIAKQLWSGDNGPFEGKHYQLTETVHAPQPLSSPHPKIMIGGSGEKKTLRMVAQYGDACNIGVSGGIDVLQHKLAVLRDHCSNLGRDYAEIEKTSNGGFGPLSRSGADGTMHPDEAFKFLEGLAASGVDTALMGILAVDAPESREIVEQELMPFAESLPVAGR
ncbi:MAG: LLM class F420-dependent oxidoreductase [Thermomicrobiales bacterium]|nr:LLM class F420-dependent oxidoreductase [Thermomicrobiales bacterium]